MAVAIMLHQQLLARKKLKKGKKLSATASPPDSAIHVIEDLMSKTNSRQENQTILQWPHYMTLELINSTGDFGL